MSRNRVSRRQPLAPRRALLIDLENLAYHGNARLAVAIVHARLRSVLLSAGEVGHTVVVAPRHAIERYGAELASLGLRWIMCAAGRDSADRHIVERAMELLALGYVEIVIASGDHYFARLGTASSLMVVVPQGLPVAAELRRASQQVVAA